MTITVSKPITAPTSPSATLVAGGSLEPSTTYYYVVFAVLDGYISPATRSHEGFHSDLSAEGTFTTDATNKSATITWTNPPEHLSTTRYDILLSTTSGDYEGVKGFNGSYDRLGTNITTGVTGYTITAVGAVNYMNHTAQSTNDFAGGLVKNTGNIQVLLEGGNYSNYGKSLYNTIVSQGYGDYVSWENNTLILKGWIVAGGTSSGYMIFYYNNFVFLRGGVHSANPNFYIQFGLWSSDIYGASVTHGCNIDIICERYAFRSVYANMLRVYGCNLTQCLTVDKTNAETVNAHYFLNGSNLAIAYQIGGIKDNIIGIYFRAYQGDMEDVKARFLNNHGNSPHYRVKMVVRATMPYTTAGGSFYACEFLDDKYISSYQPASGALYFSNLYDCKFPNEDDNKQTYHRWRIYAPQTITNEYIQYNFSLIVNATDVDGNVIEGANVSIKDKDGNSGVWIEYTDDINKTVTGTTYSTDRTTDSDGQIKYYLESYKANHNNDYPGTGTANYISYESIITDKYPYTLTITKAGYVTFTTVIKDFLGSLTLAAVMAVSPKFTLSTDGNVSKYLNPDNPKNLGLVLPL